MRIGLSGDGPSIERIVDQAVEAEGAGFTSLWYSSATLGDPLAPIVIAGRATASIELGPAVLQTYARILRLGGLERAADACIVGDEEAVAEQIRALVAAGATDIWARPFSVGDNPEASRRRTLAVLEALVREK